MTDDKSRAGDTQYAAPLATASEAVAGSAQTRMSAAEAQSWADLQASGGLPEAQGSRVHTCHDMNPPFPYECAACVEERIDAALERGAPHLRLSRVTPADFSVDAVGIKYGTLGVPLALRRDPTPKDFADPRFDVLWELMKRVDVDFRNGLFSGATGNDVCAVLDALDEAMAVDAVAKGRDVL